MQEPEELPPLEAPQPPAPSRTTELLAQILRELKSQRIERDDFSWAKLAAVLLQVATVGCALVAVFLAGQPVPYFQWMIAAVFGQLAVMAALLFSRTSR